MEEKRNGVNLKRQNQPLAANPSSESGRRNEKLRIP